MKKILLISSVLALVSAPAFAGGNFNFSTVTSAGYFNNVGVAQGGSRNINVQSTYQKGWGNTAITAQGGSHNLNLSNTVQFGGGNTAVVLQQ